MGKSRIKIEVALRQCEKVYYMKFSELRDSVLLMVKGHPVDFIEKINGTTNKDELKAVLNNQLLKMTVSESEK